MLSEGASVGGAGEISYPLGKERRSSITTVARSRSIDIVIRLDFNAL
jgi:hypothetical protein